jgi:hypothetical protein
MEIYSVPSLFKGNGGKDSFLVFRQEHPHRRLLRFFTADDDKQGCPIPSSTRVRLRLGLRVDSGGVVFELEKALESELDPG